MRIECRHGYFKFKETRVGELANFVNTFGFAISLSGDHFTFDSLVDAPKYSIEGQKYLGAMATKTFEGEPGEILRANNLIYNFVEDEVVLKSTITNFVEINNVGGYFVSTGFILPGSVTDDGSRVTDYLAWYLPSLNRFYYSEVILE